MQTKTYTCDACGGTHSHRAGSDRGGLRRGDTLNLRGPEWWSIEMGVVVTTRSLDKTTTEERKLEFDACSRKCLHRILIDKVGIVEEPSSGTFSFYVSSGPLHTDP